MTQKLLTINGIMFAALGLAFALYAPPLLGLFGILDLDITSITYWHIASFARLFGAVLFAWGLLTWGLSRGIDALPIAAQRSLLFALLLGNLAGTGVALTQQSSIWNTPAGWLVSAMFAAFTLAYGYALSRLKSE